MTKGHAEGSPRKEKKKDTKGKYSWGDPTEERMDIELPVDKNDPNYDPETERVKFEIIRVEEEEHARAAEVEKQQKIAALGSRLFDLLDELRQVAGNTEFTEVLGFKYDEGLTRDSINVNEKYTVSKEKL